MIKKKTIEMEEIEKDNFNDNEEMHEDFLDFYGRYDDED